MSSIPLKRCQRCGKFYPLDDFHNHKSHIDGKSDTCKQCIRRMHESRQAQAIAPTLFPLDGRICIHCREMKPQSEYWKDYPYCKPCTRFLRRKKYKGRSEKEKLALRRFQLKRAFNLTSEEYEEMFQKQMGLCAICGQPETHMDKKAKQVDSLSVDHCHKTGRIRELLCRNCNTLLGHAHDNPEVLRNAIAYLEKHNIKVLES